MSEGTSVRHLLRQRTGDLHVELDGILSHTDFDDRRSYASFLTRQAEPLFAIERSIDNSAFAIDLPDWAERQRSDAMRRDLAILGVAPSPPDPSNPVLDVPDQLLGALYVLEGSRLGAKYLVRQARSSRDPAVREATAYLSHGEGKPFWPTFLTVLGERENRGLDPELLIAGARSAFELFLEFG